jgi:hypothetical protein
LEEMMDKEHDAKKMVTLTEVKEGEDGWSVTTDEGWGIFLNRKEGGPTPAVGQQATIYGDGIGRPVRGVDLDGVELYYRTPEQEHEQHQEWCYDKAMGQTRDLVANEADRDRRIEALPDPFHRRFRRFYLFKGVDWRIRFETYELFVCEEAVKFAAEFETEERLLDWAKASYEIQRERLPSLSNQHSGNTFGTAVMLAQTFLHEPEMVVRQHGALHGLVGCNDYGCWASEQGSD